MLQKLPTALDELAALPRCHRLAQARAKLEGARAAEQDALQIFRAHCARVSQEGRWVRHDAAASQAEVEAIKTAAAVRLATNEVETAKRAHGSAQLGKHLAKHTPDALAILAEALRDARDVADRLAQIASTAETDGGGVSMKMQRARGAASKLRVLAEQFS